MIDYHYVAGILILFAVVFALFTALANLRGKESSTSKFVRRFALGLITTLITRVVLADSGLGTGSSIVLWGIPLGAGFTAALIWRH